MFIMSGFDRYHAPNYDKRRFTAFNRIPRNFFSNKGEIARNTGGFFPIFSLKDPSERKSQIMEQQPAKLRSQRIGCDAMFTEDDNPEGSCQYHESGPIFHDGMKEWSCCKKRSHDFSLFLAIPGCKTGKHTTEKPVFTQPKKNTISAPAPVPASNTNVSSKDSCSRCRQGFFCSDHGSQIKPLNAAVNTSSETESKASAVPKQPKKMVDINETQTCKNKGCGKEFKEKDNHDTACNYHPGPAVFHDRLRGWKCCDIHVKEFDEFMSIPPCTKGWHNADP